MKRILQQNNYPLNLIKTLINRKIKPKNDGAKNRSTNNATIDKKYISIPYINNLTDNNSLRKIIPDNNITFAHKSNYTSKHLFKNAKDRVGKLDMCNVVYEIPCKGNEHQQCNKIYIGQTKRSLNIRLSEHETDIKKHKYTTGIAKHMMEHIHTPDFDKTKILDIENKLNRRLTLESLRIRQKANTTMNNREDVDKISANYNVVLNL